MQSQSTNLDKDLEQVQKLFTELETYQQNITTLEETQSRCEFIKQQIELNKQEIAQLQKHS